MLVKPTPAIKPVVPTSAPPAKPTPTIKPASLAPSKPSNPQATSGPENHDTSPTQLSASHQTLAPSPNPSIAHPVATTNAGKGSGNVPAIPQPNPEAAPIASNKSPDVQLQPISTAIFGNQPPSNDAAQSSSPDAGIASPAPPGQGVPAGPKEQTALTRDPNGGLIIGSSTIMPGQAATINNHQVSVGSSSVLVDSNTYAFAPPTSPAPTPITVAGLSMQTASEGGVILAGQTLAPGVQTTIGGHAISVVSGNVVVDGNTQILPTSVPAPPLQPLTGGSTMQRASNGAVIIGSSTLPLDSQATIAGHVISVGTANVVIDGTTNALPNSAPTASQVLLNSQTIQRASNGGLVIGSLTLAPGTQTKIAGHVISVGPNNAVLDSSTYALPPVAGATLVSSPEASAQRNAITLPNGSILSAGGSPVTISGQIISVPSNDQGAVIDGSTMLFASPTAQSVFTVGGQIFTASSSSFVVGGATVSLDGAPITIAGTVVSLGPSGLQIGSMTEQLANATPTGLGGYVMSAFDAPTSAAANGTGPISGGRANATGAEAYTGVGARLKGDIWLMVVTVVMGMGVGMVAVLM